MATFARFELFLETRSRSAQGGLIETANEVLRAHLHHPEASTRHAGRGHDHGSDEHDEQPVHTALGAIRRGSGGSGATGSHGRDAARSYVLAIKVVVKPRGSGDNEREGDAHYHETREQTPKRRVPGCCPHDSHRIHARTSGNPQGG